MLINYVLMLVLEGMVEWCLPTHTSGNQLIRIEILETNLV